MTGETDLRLVAPRLTDAELTFLLALHKLEPGVEMALQDLNHALLHSDVEAGVRAALRFSSIGPLMYAAQEKVTRS